MQGKLIHLQEKSQWQVPHFKEFPAEHTALFKPLTAKPGEV